MQLRQLRYSRQDKAAEQRRRRLPLQRRLFAGARRGSERRAARPTTKDRREADRELRRPAVSFVVQIAAVTREEDAAALAGALRKKNYSVFVVNNPAVHDKFYHVQIGPFATLQDADAMKAKLTGEGYNPIVKRS